jgi:hypothetical protein
MELLKNNGNNLNLCAFSLSIYYISQNGEGSKITMANSYTTRTIRN